MVFIVIYKPSVWCPLQLAPFKRIKREAETTFRSRNNDLAILYIWNTILPISSHPFLYSLSQFLFLPTLDHLPFHCPVRHILSLLSFPIFPSRLPLLPSHSHPSVPTFNSFWQPLPPTRLGMEKLRHPLTDMWIFMYILVYKYVYICVRVVTVQIQYVNVTVYL